jgi:arginase family enzyme
MALIIDFGYSDTTASWNDAYLALLFAAKADPSEIGKASGPLAIADASRFVELFECQIGLSPLGVGTYAEAVGGDNPAVKAIERAAEARARGMFPIVIGDDRRITDLGCRDPLVALWGKVGRIEVDETAILSRSNPSILAGVRAATANAFQAIPGNVTILTASALAQHKEFFKEALSRVSTPVHLSIDFDVLAPAVAQTGRSLEPGGLGWYDLMDLIELVFEGPGVAAVDLVGTALVGPRTPAALLGSQILLRVAGLLAVGLGE